MDCSDSTKSLPNAYEMRWKCERDGCFNVKKRVKFNVFASSLPGMINFSDVDGIVEINGKFLLIEMKEKAGKIPTGQRIMFERMTADGRFTVLVLAGSAETMKVEMASVFYRGRFIEWRRKSIDDILVTIKMWVRSTFLAKNNEADQPSANHHRYP